MTEKRQKFGVGAVFGVFDGLHEGHRFLLQEAAARCDRLVVVLAIPEMVFRLKGHYPKYPFERRMSEIQVFDPRIEVIPSDAEPRTWGSLRELDPDVVFLGYDQQALGRELETLGVARYLLDPHRPDIYKSSLLNR